MSEIKVNKISPKQTCTQLTLGDSGDTIIIPAGATITNNGTATGFGRTGSVNWDTTPKTTTVTAVSGTGYFVDTTSAAITVNLPAGTAGDIVAISDYANTAATNNITIDPNGTDKINGVNQNATISTNGASVTLLYVDSTRGWKDINDATLDLTGIPPFVSATGGTITTCGDYKIHSFTGPGTFTVTNAGSPAGSNTVDYLVVAGAGGGGGNSSGGNSRGGGGGGAGGYRESKATGAPWTASPLATSTSLPVSATAYPITVGAGGSPGPIGSPSGGNGSPSIFSTITSAGGGGGIAGDGSGGLSTCSKSGGSGGGLGSTGPNPRDAAAGNTPPVSPPQGNPGGGPRPAGDYATGTGGGGATTAGPPGMPGGTGATSSISGSPVVRATGGAGGSWSYCSPYPLSPLAQVPGAANSGTGGGGGQTGPLPQASWTGTPGGSGGSGIVVIRYKFQ
jgi:hypothetical protein